MRDLHEEYKIKVKEGEIEKKRANIGYIGKGYRFDEDEENQVKQQRQELSKAYGLTTDDRDENDLEFEKAKTTKENEEQEKQEHF